MKEINNAYLKLQIYLVIHSYCTPAESIEERNWIKGIVLHATIDTSPQIRLLTHHVYITRPNRLTDDHLVILFEVVRGNLEVERRRSLSYAAGDVVVRAVAGAEPAAKVAGLADGDASEMGADACFC